MGYINFSWSERSEWARHDFEVPLSIINKELLDVFFDTDWVIAELKSEIGIDIEWLKNITVEVIKFTAKRYNTCHSWHHTGCKYRKTDHYCLRSIFEKIADVGLEEIKKQIKQEKQNKIGEIGYCILKYRDFSFSGGRSRYHGDVTVIGLAKNGWLYTGDRKHQLEANKTVEYTTYSTYREFTKKNPNYKKTKPIFDKIKKN